MSIIANWVLLLFSVKERKGIRRFLVWVSKVKICFAFHQRFIFLTPNLFLFVGMKILCIFFIKIQCFK